MKGKLVALLLLLSTPAYAATVDIGGEGSTGGGTSTGSITLANGETITNGTDGTITFTANNGQAEDLALDLSSVSNLMTLTSSTGLNSIYLGNSNANFFLSPAGGRSYFGLDSVSGNAVVQGGSSKGIEFDVNNATFGSGTVAVITSTGNMTVTGQLVVDTASDVGWTVKSGANTACNTTCIHGCVFGIETSTNANGILACTDATADQCLCAGPT